MTSPGRAPAGHVRARARRRLFELPILVASFLLTFSLAGTPLYVSSTASASLREQFATTCPSDTTLRLAFEGGSAQQARTVEDADREARWTLPVRQQGFARVRLPRSSGVELSMYLLSVPGQGDAVSPSFAPLGVGEIAMSSTTARQLDVAVGDAMVAGDGLRLHVVAIFDDAISQGHRQRVALARALAGRPVAAVIDEPTSYQDAGNSDRVVRALVGAARAGVAVLVASHDRRVIDAADRVIDL